MTHYDYDQKNGMRPVVGGPYVLSADVRKAFEFVDSAEGLLSSKPRSVTAIDGALLELQRALSFEV